MTVTGKNVDTGELEVQDITVISQTLLTKDEAIQQTFEYFLDPEAQYEIEFGTAEVIDIQVNLAGVT